MIKLGQKSKDRITGFEGLCMGAAQYLTGCSQVQLVPTTLDKEGKRREGEWFDEQRVQAIGDEVVDLNNDATPGRDESLPQKKN